MLYPPVGMWARNGETDGDEEDEDVFGNVPLSAAARMAASSAGRQGGKAQSQLLTRGGEFGAFGEKKNHLTPEEDANSFQDMLLVYGGSGGEGGHHGKKKKKKHSLYMAYDHKNQLKNVEDSNALKNQEESDNTREDLRAIKHASQTSHVTKCLDLITGEWRSSTAALSILAQE